MSTPIMDIVPAMREFNVSNDLIGDHAALQARWNEDGYLFFRDVLDHEPLERMRGLLVDHLDSHGFVDRNDRDVRWTGKERENFSFFPVKAMNEQRAARTVMEDPAIRAFFQRLFGVPLYWVPFTEYRTSPPAIDKSRTRFDFIHEDAIYSDRLDFIICWIPLSDIDAQVGGLAVAEGLHKLPCLHRKDGDKIIPIDLASVPEDAWRRTNYRLGDVLLMSRRTPHSGLSNHSDRFRLSLDTRILPHGGSFPFEPRLPYVGTLTSIASGQIVVRDAHGEHVLRLDETSYLRGFQGNRLRGDEIADVYQPGCEVIVAHEGGLVQTLRPQH
ncbi:phytanoyl-CoA dioxygenase family protein [Paraburkholderia sp. JPY432]|uniref:phytanoyl-CoA dioxygenase family protein n=1 Tax=Paraburkholderia youngii TaxID=2782701 RepID=UPI001595E9E6|nr:phytanoyl-CoA dioxygenase family protein [Paraburkholderia youngii]NVH71915.1 phytanoyl-CoA dioxygenase family protein [Paraburkholderia youngii]